MESLYIFTWQAVSNLRSLSNWGLDVLADRKLHQFGQLWGCVQKENASSIRASA